MIEIKICGLTNAGDARTALAAGADYLGFVLYPGSRRAVTPATLAAIVADLPAAARTVGVFVDAPRETVLDVARACRLWAVQMHGAEAPGDWQGTGLRVWRAVRFAGGQWMPDPADWPAERWVVDAAVPGQPGGTGVTADWAAAARLAPRYRVMLGGGLTPANVAAAVTAVRPAGVDVASGVEAAPGRKDHGKIAAFIAAARAAGSHSPDGRLVAAGGDDAPPSRPGSPGFRQALEGAAPSAPEFDGQNENSSATGG
jgi:phosphoribosylanthranilate isomerase